MPITQLMIKDLSTSSYNWKIHVQVLEKHPPQNARPKEDSKNRRPVTYQRIILGDAEGNEIQASVFNELIPTFERALVLNHYYSVQNARINISPSNCRHGITNLQLNLHSSTIVEPLQPHEIFHTEETIQFIPFNKLRNYLYTETEINIIGVVAHIHQSKKLTRNLYDAREMIIIDQLCMPITMTLWHRYAEKEGKEIEEAHMSSPYPIISILHARVSSYNGMTLTTHNCTKFIVNPATPASDDLRRWRDKHLHIIREVPPTIASEHHNTDTGSCSSAGEDFILITNLPKFVRKPTAFWIRAYAIIRRWNQSFITTTCSSCKKKVEGAANQRFFCYHCYAMNTAIPRTTIELELHDSSGQLTSLVYGSLAENLFDVTLDDLIGLEIKAFKNLEPTPVQLFRVLHQPNVHPIPYSIVAIDYPKFEEEGENMSSSTNTKGDDHTSKRAKPSTDSSAKTSSSQMSEDSLRSYSTSRRSTGKAKQP